MIIEQTPLPGLGTSYVATTATGRRLGVVNRRDGRRDLVVYDPEDGESVAISVLLDAAEARCLAGLLLDAVVVVPPPAELVPAAVRD